jgi:glycosyltransferase involved in cell wall biosynthesis
VQEKVQLSPAGASNGKKIVVSNGCHRFHMYQTALAYEQAGRLRHLIAGWYPKPGLVSRMIESGAFARVFGDRAAKRVLARRQEGLDPAKVVSLRLPDAIERLGRWRTGNWVPSGLFSYYSMLAFGWLSQRYVTQGDLFHVRSGYGRFAMARAKDSGAVCLVDHSIADPGFIREIMVSEAKRWGLSYEFADLHWRCVSRDIDEADHILANSEFVRDTLAAARGISREKTSVLPLPVDLHRFSPAADRRDDGKFRILFVGEIGLRKGVLYLLEAVKKLQFPQIELVMVGGVTEIDSLIAQGSYDFRHIPTLPQEDLVALFQGASVFVFPSLVEGSARVIQEAMACGLPIITTPNSGSVVREGVEGFIVPIRDSETLAEKILDLYNDPRKRQEMGLAARATAERRFSLQAYRDGLVGLMDKLLQKKT